MKYYVKVEMNLEIDNKQTAENLKQLEHHAEYLLDLDSHPEITSVFGVKVSEVECCHSISNNVPSDNEVRRVMVEIIEYFVSHWKPSVCIVGGNSNMIGISFLKFPIVVADIIKSRRIIDKFTGVFCDDGYETECDAASYLSESLELVLNKCGFHYTDYIHLRPTTEAICYINEQLNAKIHEYDRTHAYPAVVEFIHHVLGSARNRRIECCSKEEILSFYETHRMH